MLEELHSKDHLHTDKEDDEGTCDCKEPTSMLKILRSFSPNIRNARKMASETRVAFHGCMAPLFDLISNIIGIDPGISMMANNTMKQAVISRK